MLRAGPHAASSLFWALAQEARVLAAIKIIANMENLEFMDQ
jgi:hypothetical protein